MKKEILYTILGVALLTTMSYVYAHSEFTNPDNDEKHRQHHIEMHGTDEGFEEMHETCEKIHGEDMEGHHKLMHGEIK